VPWVSAQSISVETTSLDNFFEGEGWPSVKVIKMDIEGAEKAALEGMRQLVARNLSLKLIMEFSPGTQVGAGVSPDELFSILTEIGFTKFFAIRSSLEPLNIPQDIPHLVQMAGGGYVNLLCEK